jgi:hypothetical protein
MFRFQYSVITKAEPGLCWDVFTDCSRWNSFADIYGAIEWAEGAAWEPGSRLEIEILRPFQTKIEHVITCSVPGKRVGWIDHAMGAALAEWVTFEGLPKGGTRVTTWGDLVHSGRPIAGRSAEDLITGFVKVWYENFAAICDQIAVGTAMQSHTPLSFPSDF